jgi:NAD(P)-dependent dehydrogenase (short-subunit alcohol dehydrogenase family)
MRDPGKFVLPSLAAAELAAAEQLWIGRLDVTDAGQVHSTIADAFDALGHIDVVVSNAGFGVHGAAEEATDAQVESIVATNLTGSIQVARAVTPFLRAQGGGKIIQVSSMAGHLTRAGSSLYNATKWGVEGFFEAFAQEVAPFGIGVNIIAPGRFPTSFYEAAERPAAQSAYAKAGVITRMPTVLGLDEIPGDLERLIDVILSVGDDAQSPLRLLIGSDCYVAALGALKERVTRLEAQREIAYSTDRAQ